MLKEESRTLEGRCSKKKGAAMVTFTAQYRNILTVKKEYFKILKIFQNKLVL
jgi:hypothetical protein